MSVLFATVSFGDFKILQDTNVTVLDLGLAAGRLLNCVDKQPAFGRKHHPVDGFFRFRCVLLYVCMCVCMHVRMYLIIYINVTGFRKTDHIVTIDIARNTDLKY